MNLSSVVGHAWAVTHELSCATGPTWVVTRERPCRYKSTNLVIIFAENITVAVLVASDLAGQSSNVRVCDTYV